MVTTETGQIFYDDGTDKPVFNHFFHFPKARSVKGRAGNAVIRKEAIISYALLFAVVLQNLFLMRDTVRFQFFFIFLLVFLRY